MFNTCVCCGNIIPEGRQVCYQCENGGGNDGVLCPECGAVLEIMSCHWYNTIDGHAKNTIFHCNACHNDWEKNEEYVAQPVKFSRKFWG